MATRNHQLLGTVSQERIKDSQTHFIIPVDTYSERFSASHIEDLPVGFQYLYNVSLGGDKTDTAYTYMLAGCSAKLSSMPRTAILDDSRSFEIGTAYDQKHQAKHVSL